MLGFAFILYVIIISLKCKFGARSRILEFVKSSIQIKHQTDLELTDLEALWLEVCPHKSNRPLLIAGVYRPASYKVVDDRKLGKNIQ